MWCDFLCDGCPNYAECHRSNNDYDVEELQHKTVRTQEEYNEMYKNLAEEEWDR